MRKRRTRSHIIADLSANHFERQALLCGYSVERVFHDYGVDLLLSTYTDEGEPENDTVKIQLKATEHLPVLKDGQTISFPILRADLEYWLDEWTPVILIVYDAQEEMAYWCYIQAHFQQQAEFNLRMIGESVRIPIDKARIVNPDAVRQFAQFKANIQQQFRGVNHEIV